MTLTTPCYCSGDAVKFTDLDDLSVGPCPKSGALSGSQEQPRGYRPTLGLQAGSAFWLIEFRSSRVYDPTPPFQPSSSSIKATFLAP